MTLKDTHILHGWTDWEVNGNGHTYSGLDSGLLLWAIINAILFILILGGNILTILALRTCRNLRSVISNLFILSLAMSDFIVGISLPYHVAFYMGSDLGRVRGYCLLRFFLFICACCVSILTLISIAVDRYIAVIYALHYRRYMTRRMAYVIITFNWCLGACVALIPIFWNNWKEAQECEFDEVLSPWYVAGIITPAFIVIWICMLMVYWRIMREASKQAKRLRHSVIYDAAHTGASLHPDWKSVQIVVFIMGSFTICWLPFFGVAIAQLFQMCRSNSIFYKTAFSLAMTNSALNPIIYSWKNTTFRKAFAQTLCCCRRLPRHAHDLSTLPEVPNCPKVALPEKPSRILEEPPAMMPETCTTVLPTKSLSISIHCTEINQ
ncbi:histamine H2 receptor [Scaptodrosophila lebanonensis]|uniref:Histamine H2 receptor n=1 Tax=Drosophila lebanonensis TaxID=7225 RepID=A0A6J2TWW8_DROLE|nr:histamine H2 receptor [Scaptodrosophila lebanonensis]